MKGEHFLVWQHQSIIFHSQNMKVYIQTSDDGTEELEQQLFVFQVFERHHQHQHLKNLSLHRHGCFLEEESEAEKR